MLGYLGTQVSKRSRQWLKVTHLLADGPAPSSKAVDSIPSALSHQEHADPWVLWRLPQPTCR